MFTVFVVFGDFNPLVVQPRWNHSTHHCLPITSSCGNCAFGNLLLVVVGSCTCTVHTHHNGQQPLQTLLISRMGFCHLVMSAHLWCRSTCTPQILNPPHFSSFSHLHIHRHSVGENGLDCIFVHLKHVSRQTGLSSTKISWNSLCAHSNSVQVPPVVISILFLLILHANPWFALVSSAGFAMTSSGTSSSHCDSPLNSWRWKKKGKKKGGGSSQQHFLGQIPKNMPF